ncbi:hypothetical protein B0H10DRAFT_2237647 [Mycena sp. CBHHK59/15]|nr:hypothetical protein B0H10DRAFT_2237647 [Mycena sp. CBHHK59/15]
MDVAPSLIRPDQAGFMKGRKIEDQVKLAKFLLNYAEVAEEDGLNDRILPAYKFTPNELCLGLVVNTNDTPLEISTSELAENEVGLQNAYLEQQTLDAYSHVVEHAIKRKEAFDKRVMNSGDGVIEYKKGDLVQILDSSLDLTLSTESKILPCWGQPHRVVDCIRNSYRLETIHGLPGHGAV